MIGWAVRRPALVWAAAAGLVLAGGGAATRLPLATRPAIDYPRLRVEVGWPGAAAELVEAYLTAPIEGALQGVPGVKRLASESDEGHAQLTVHLTPETDVQLARLGILERLELLRRDFPEGVASPQVSNYVPQELAEQPLLRYTLAGPHTPGTLARIGRERVEPRIAAMPGVAGVIVTGGAETGVAVAYDGTRLRQVGVDPEALATALRDARIVRGLGRDRIGPIEYMVVLRDQPPDIAALAALPVRGRGAQVFRLGDLATIRLDEDTRDQFYRVNGEPAVALGVSRAPGADAIRTARAVRGALDALAPELPPGTTLRLQSDESAELERQLGGLTVRGAIAAGLVIIVLVIGLRNIRAIALALASVVVAVAGTALGLYLLGISANLLTLAGLGMGIGILVQNGVVVVERLRYGPDTPEGRAAAGRRIAPAVLGATLTTAVVLLPFVYLQGNARAAFVPFAAAFALALGWSVVASLLMIPALGVGHKLRPVTWRQPLLWYMRVLGRLVRRRAVTLSAAAVLVAVAGWGFVNKVPRFDWGNWWGARSTLYASLRFPRGSDPTSLDRGMRGFERVVVGRAGVDQVIAQGWRDGSNLVVSFTPEGGRSALPYILEEELTQRAILIGGAEVAVRYEGPGYYSGGGAAPPTFRIKILGYSFGEVARIAQDLKDRLERIPRVRDVDANAASFWRQERAIGVTLEPDRAALARYGLTARAFAAAVSREVGGPVGAQRLEVGGEELRVTLKRDGTRDRTLDELRSALVPTAAGAPVRVADVATVEERETLSRISREDQQYVRIVSYEFRGPQRLAERTHKAFLGSIELPPGYSASDESFLGFGSDESAQGLWLVFAGGAVLVVLAIAAVFDSTWAAALVVPSIPFALSGAAAAFWISGATFTREAAVGAILVVGLAVNQSILFVDACLARRREPGGGRRSLTAGDVLRAARERAGVVMVVTLTTLASLAPLTVGTDPSELFGAIALAAVGGTLAGTVGALAVLPALAVRWRVRGTATP